MRTRCVHAARDAAQVRGHTPRPRDVDIAQIEIAANFGFENWDSFSRSPLYATLERWVRPALATLAQAKRVRSACANGELLFDE
jgi:hypothetical protein